MCGAARCAAAPSAGQSIARSCLIPTAPPPSPPPPGTHKFEIVFASSDRERSAYTEYLGEMPWAAFPYEDKRIAALSAKLKVNGIPTFVILDGEGKVVCAQGRQSVMGSPMSEFPFRTPSFAEVFEGVEYIASEGANRTWDDLKGLDAIGVYFSAHWCGPVRLPLRGAPCGSGIDWASGGGGGVPGGLAGAWAAPCALRAPPC